MFLLDEVAIYDFIITRRYKRLTLSRYFDQEGESVICLAGPASSNIGRVGYNMSRCDIYHGGATYTAEVSMAKAH